MELELKHLTAYLPYKLKAEILDWKCNYVNRQFDLLTGLDQWDKSGKLWSVSTEGGAKPSIDRIKPILRPLLDLTFEIEINDKKIIPIEELAKIEFSKHNKLIFVRKFDNPYPFWTCYEARIKNSENVYDFGYSSEIDFFYFHNQKNNFNACTFNKKLKEMLLNWHFDVFGLIRNNLAIDINTLK